jgi:hypothetical protein
MEFDAQEHSLDGHDSWSNQALSVFGIVVKWLNVALTTCWAKVVISCIEAPNFTAHRIMLSALV